MNNKCHKLNIKHISPAPFGSRSAQRFLSTLCLLTAVFFGQMLTAGAAVFSEGSVIRPVQEDAKVKGCRIAAPGDYEVGVGDVIELDYTYPVVPAAMPTKTFYKQTTDGAVTLSPLGVRRVVTPGRLGTTTMAFYFEAKQEGEETITLIIDKDEYVYKFKVVKR